MSSALLAAQYRIAELEDKARRQTIAMACTLVSLIDLRDRYTGGHCSRVAKYSRNTAIQLGLNDSEIETIELASSLHDVGKIGVPDTILLKPDKLTDDEFEWIKKHSECGWMALRSVEGLEQESLMVLHHHERMDGRGYPGNLYASEIPLGSRIIAVADSFDAMTSNRPYRASLTRGEAFEELGRCAGSQFDPLVVTAFGRCIFA
jgi:HD-GYP domain-containing protein (c-di-GMP phosphodiesterase class II)